MQNKTEQIKTKKHTFKSDAEREVGVCIAVQKIGLASTEEIIQKIENWGSKMTEKQVNKCAENLRRRQILSVDISSKENGISIRKYAMRNLKLSLPEIAQLKDIIDDPSVNELKEELDRSKRTQKKGLKTFDYYACAIKFKTKGEVQGFIPDERGIVRHYKEDDKVVFHPYHFRNWFRDNLPLINRSSSAIGDIKFQEGESNADKKDLKIIEKYITNVESGFHSSRGTGGRGSRKIECLPSGTKINTVIVMPRDLISPDRIYEALEKMTKFGSAFGGGAKLSTGRLIVESVEIQDEMIWKEE